MTNEEIHDWKRDWIIQGPAGYGRELRVYSRRRGKTLSDMV